MPGLIYNTLSYLNRKDIHVDVNFQKYKENVNFLSYWKSDFVAFSLYFTLLPKFCKVHTLSVQRSLYS